MASDNLLSRQLWPFRTAFSDPWISDLFTRESEALTEALQLSFAGDSAFAGFFPVETVEPVIEGVSVSESASVSKRIRDQTALSDAWTEALQQTFAADSSYAGFFPVETVEPVFEKLPVQTPSGSVGSESEAAPVSKRRRGVPPSGRAAKRKARQSKRGTTTFIAADPENFRRMVQEVTGGNLGGLSPMDTLLQPEVHNVVGLLDTSSLFVDGFAPTAVAQPHPPSAGGGSGRLEFDSYCSFPTLESWNAVPVRGFS